MNNSVVVNCRRAIELVLDSIQRDTQQHNINDSNSKRESEQQRTSSTGYCRVECFKS
jgi:hypothetical protein